MAKPVSNVTPARGMRDVLPAEKARREAILSAIRQTYRQHGFDEIETPVAEDNSVLHSGLGGDNEKLAFAIMRRGLEQDDLTKAASANSPLELSDLGLRFDLTVPLARFYASHKSELPPVFRALHVAPVWRAERPQKGRYRQFVQCDIDILGEAGALAEVELIAATADVLSTLGVTGCSIRINDRRVLTSLLSHWQVAEADHSRVLITLDKLDKLGVDGVAAELVSLAVSPVLTDPTAVATRISELATATWDSVRAVRPEWLAADVLDHLLGIAEALPNVDIRFDPTLVRGMGYYTGTVFEVAHPDLPYSLGGGGRYDGMIGGFLGQDVPACGFSLGFERLVDLVTLPDTSSTPARVVLVDESVSAADILLLKQELIAGGARVRIERKAKNTRAQLDRLIAYMKAKPGVWFATHEQVALAVKAQR